MRNIYYRGELYQCPNHLVKVLIWDLEKGTEVGTAIRRHCKCVGSCMNFTDADRQAAVEDLMAESDDTVSLDDDRTQHPS
jgi:hypothetical protein